MQWQPGAQVDRRLLRFGVRGAWWDILKDTSSTLLVTREYEHLVAAITAPSGKPRVSYLRLPHPSGLAVDPCSRQVYVASTRNPNMILELAPCRHLVPRDGFTPPPEATDVLLPVRCCYLPGCLYLHDLALIGGRLHANAVAMNAVIELPLEGGAKVVWWPRCLDRPEGPLLGRNYLQLNSIAAGKQLADSFFSASAARPSARRPGHLNFPVDRRGVVFSGATREVVATGLTRPHSARLLGSELWVANSGYGEVGIIQNGRFEPVSRLPGWTRGLCARGDVLFVGTSRVIPRYRRYAPGLECERSLTGVHAVERRSGRVLGSLIWPHGHQIFAIDIVDAVATIGFPFTSASRVKAGALRDLLPRISGSNSLRKQ